MGLLQNKQNYFTVVCFMLFASSEFIILPKPPPGRWVQKDAARRCFELKKSEMSEFQKFLSLEINYDHEIRNNISKSSKSFEKGA
jgi:hypothetical protein